MTNRTAVPAEFTDQEFAFGGNTDKQWRFICDLLAKREVPETWVARIGQLVEARELTMAKASQTIDALLTLPFANERDYTRGTKVTPAADKPKFRRWETLPDGRYALDMPDDVVNPVHFYTISTVDNEGDDWHGFQRLTRHSSDERYPVKGQTRRDVMDAIADDPRAASIRYGHESEHCGVCGRELTRPESRAAGIGPVCADKLGW